MMEQISPDGKPITGGLLFRKYPLNRCQEDFERGWKHKESAAAAAMTLLLPPEKEENKESGETPQFSEEYYAVQKAKQQGLGLVKFIGELFKLQMLTGCIMHECIKKLSSSVINYEEEEIESLCIRMKKLAKSSNVLSRMQFMELRERKWNTRMAVAGMSRGGSCCSHGRDNNSQIGPDGWAIAPGPSRPADKAGYFSGFGKFSKSGEPVAFGPHTKARESPGTSSNMLSMLGVESAAEVSALLQSSHRSRPPSRNADVDLSHGVPVEPTQRRKLYLIPRSKLLAEKQEEIPAPQPEDKEGENREKAESSISNEQSEKKIDQDRKSSLPYATSMKWKSTSLRCRRSITTCREASAIESKKADARLVGDLFERAISRNLCSPASYEEGLIPAAELLDDIAIDAAKAFDLMVIMMKGAKLNEERRMPIASKSMDDDKPLSLSA
ncbi:armadillo-type protein [Phellopilus nigrolimitatus]|nr:armadillo-type protein [Phellopilus nigrolimitatus]